MSYQNYLHNCKHLHIEPMTYNAWLVYAAKRKRIEKSANDRKT